MEEIVEATLDLANCKYLGELHQRIKTALDFPEHYGENWDAFWDSIQFDTPVNFIKIIGEDTVAENLKPQLEKLHKLLQLCKENCTALGLFFDYEIASK